MKIREFFFFYDVHKENMFTINLEHGREAPSKASYLNNSKMYVISKLKDVLYINKVQFVLLWPQKHIEFIDVFPI